MKTFTTSLLVFVLFININAKKIEDKTKEVLPSNTKNKITTIVAEKVKYYYALNQKKASLIFLNGPGKLKIITRARFEKRSLKELDYTIIYRIDGGTKKYIKYKNITHSTDAKYKVDSLGTPAIKKELEIDIKTGDHNIEIWIENDNPKVAARYLFTSKKKKKVEWIAISPTNTFEMVNLKTNESLITYYRFSNEHPLKVKINGPTQLKILTRAENLFDMKGRINYRLQIKEDDKIKNTFVLNSVRSETTLYEKETDKIPGKANEIIIDIPKGRHHIQIIPLDNNNLLARLLFPKKDIKLSE